MCASPDRADECSNTVFSTHRRSGTNTNLYDTKTFPGANQKKRWSVILARTLTADLGCSKAGDELLHQLLHLCLCLQHYPWIQWELILFERGAVLTDLQSIVHGQFWY